jgi:cytochrome bd ubiquinol oxidase subunit II
MDTSWLNIFWVSLIAFAMLFYVILDGYDLGVGILYGTVRNGEFRSAMKDAIAPFWDGNEVWLVLIAAGLFGAFPIVYGIFLPAFYLPMALMLSGLIIRGVSFEFRHHAGPSRWIWDWGFFLGSLLASFIQGAVIGRLVQTLPVMNGQYSGGAFDWLTRFSVFCGMGLVSGYALLGAAWLVLRTEGPLREWAYGRIRWLLVAVLAILAMVSWSILTMHHRVMDRWLGNTWLVVFPMVVALASIWLGIGVRKRLDHVPYQMAVVIFLAAFLALESSFWPYMIPFSITVQEAAAPVETLEFLFYGAGIFIFPIVLFYTGTVYWTLRGKV